MLYQDQLAIIGDLSGPGCLGPFSFLQSLLTADFTVGFPTWKTLRTEREREGVMLIFGCIDEWMHRCKQCYGKGKGDNERVANGGRRQERWSREITER